MKIGKFEIDKIYCGDCLELMKGLPNNSIDLCYVDPPFFTKKNFKHFSDRWENMNEYLKFIELRMNEIYRVLEDTGSFYLHCDWHANAYLRILLDKLFGEKNFKNEIIWHYHTAGVSKRWWGRKSDTIFFYTKSKNWVYNLIKEKRYYRKKFFKVTEGYQKETNGRLYSMVYPDNVWEIPAVLNLSKEYQDYSTQKPERLLVKIIKASSNKDDIILDPFFGSGTTLAVALKLGRHYLGFDISEKAYEIATARLSQVQVSML